MVQSTRNEEKHVQEDVGSLNIAQIPLLPGNQDQSLQAQMLLLEQNYANMVDQLNQTRLKGESLLVQLNRLEQERLEVLGHLARQARQQGRLAQKTRQVLEDRLEWLDKALQTQHENLDHLKHQEQSQQSEMDYLGQLVRLNHQTLSDWQAQQAQQAQQARSLWQRIRSIVTNRRFLYEEQAEAQKPVIPPKYAELILYIALPREIRNNALGDLEEDFKELLAKHGARSAIIFYWTQALRSLPPGFWDFFKRLIVRISFGGGMLALLKRLIGG